MGRHSLAEFVFSIRLPYGKREWRVRCPNCGNLHADLADGGLSFCLGCARLLVVRGDELYVSAGPYSSPDDSDGRGPDDPDRDQPDLPSFWYEI